MRPVNAVGDGDGDGEGEGEGRRGSWLSSTACDDAGAVGRSRKKQKAVRKKAENRKVGRRVRKAAKRQGRANPPNLGLMT